MATPACLPGGEPTTHKHVSGPVEAEYIWVGNGLPNEGWLQYEKSVLILDNIINMNLEIQVKAA